MKTLEVLEKVLRGKLISKHTTKNYRRALGSLAEYSEEWPVSGAVINEWIVSLGGYADRTVKLFYIMGKSAGRYMKRVWKVENPFEESETPIVKKQQRRYFTVEEMVRIIRSCNDDNERVLIGVLVDSACRIGELAGIKVEGVGDGYILLAGKTGQRRYRLDRRFCVMMHRFGEGGKPIFPDKYHPERSAGVDALSQRVRKIIRRAGVTGSKLGPHTLRHTSASLVASETGSALMVKAILQHDDIDTSMEYIHDVDDKLQQEVSPLELLHNKAFGDGVGFDAKQIGMGEVESAEVVEGEVFDVEASMYMEVPDGVSVRPLLKEADLRLLRRVFIWYARCGESIGDEVSCRELFKRMLRRVK